MQSCIKQCLAHLYETYPGGCRTWLRGEFQRLWRYRAKNVNNAVVDLEDHAVTVRGRGGAIPTVPSWSSDGIRPKSSLWVFVESFVYPSATA